jgi:hypothetical protein
MWAKWYVLRNVKYSEPPNTGLSGIQMVIFRTVFKSGFQMVLAYILFFTIRKPDKKSGFQMVHHLFTIWNPDQSFLTSSLDSFIKNIFFLWPFINKTV